MAEEKNLLMVTISGRDRPGISAAFAKVLMAHKVELADIEQASPQDILGLYMLLDLGPAEGSKDSVIKDLLFEASRLDLTLNFKLYGEEEVRKPKGGCYVLSHFGGTAALAAIAEVLGASGVNIEMISTLDHHGPLAMEMTLKMGRVPAGKVKKRLLAVSREEGFDLAMQTVDAYRKNKRMVFFDMDSTLISQEVIDELARLQGVHRQVARITEKAMRGDFDFEESLRQRVALLKGLPQEKMAALRDELKLNQGVREVVATLKWMGYQLGLVSGGFHYFADHLKDQLGLDYAFANRLQIKDGKLTGKLDGEIIDAAAKARILNQVACEQGILLDQVVAVGDGANDALMLGQAGLGIAFNAKKKLDDVANAALGRLGMTNILHLLGITEGDIEEALNREGC